MTISTTRTRTAVGAGALLAILTVQVAAGSGGGNGRAQASGGVGKKVKKLTQRVDQLEQQLAALQGQQDGGGAPSGSAGGDLTGTYPDPAIAANAVGSDEVDGSLTGADIANTSSLGTADIDESSLFNDNSLTGGDVDESSLGQVPSAATATNAGSLDGIDSLGFTKGKGCVVNITDNLLEGETNVNVLDADLSSGAENFDLLASCSAADVLTLTATTTQSINNAQIAASYVEDDPTSNNAYFEHDDSFGSVASFTFDAHDEAAGTLVYHTAAGDFSVSINFIAEQMANGPPFASCFVGGTAVIAQD